MVLYCDSFQFDAFHLQYEEHYFLEKNVSKENGDNCNDDKVMDNNFVQIVPLFQLCKFNSPTRSKTSITFNFQLIFPISIFFQRLASLENFSKLFDRINFFPRGFRLSNTEKYLPRNSKMRFLFKSSRNS